MVEVIGCIYGGGNNNQNAALDMLNVDWIKEEEELKQKDPASAKDERYQSFCRIYCI